MPYGEYAQCPCCRKTAYDKDEIEKEFGYRNMGDGRYIPSHIVVNVVLRIAKQESLARSNEGIRDYDKERKRRRKYQNRIGF